MFRPTNQSSVSWRALLHLRGTDWYADEAVREHLHDGYSIAGKHPAWHPGAGPIWNPYTDDEWYFAAEDLPWIALNITRRRGANRPADNDDEPASDPAS